MNNTDYTALYQSADALSLSSQKVFFRMLFGHLFFLVAAAVISVINSTSPEVAIVQALVLLGALACWSFSPNAPKRYTPGIMPWVLAEVGRILTCSK